MTRYDWHPDNLRLCERRLRIAELIAFPLTAFAFGFGLVTAWAFWG